MSTTEADAPTTVSLDLLCLLDSYDAAHGAARASQKTGQWKIGMARREKGGFHLQSPSASSISSLNVREELRARAMVVVCGTGRSSTTTSSSAVGSNDNEPALVDEHDASDVITEGGEDDSKETATGDLFTLHPDGITKGVDTRRNKSNLRNLSSAAADTTTDIRTEERTSSTSSSSGLRQRKNVPKTNATPSNSTAAAQGKSEWSEETPPAVLTGEEMEEEKLRNADPIDLFGGLPPPSLRVAQVKAREALASYVEAANRAAEILKMINEAEHADRK